MEAGGIGSPYSTASARNYEAGTKLHVFTEFVGRYERRVDPKGRVALPAEFREQLEPRCFLTIGQGCIQVLPRENWNEVATKMLEKTESGEITERERRRFSESAALVAIDGQNRVTVSRELLDHAGIASSSDVLIVGNINRLEIWNPAQRAAMD